LVEQFAQCDDVDLEARKLHLETTGSSVLMERQFADGQEERAKLDLAVRNPHRRSDFARCGRPFSGESPRRQRRRRFRERRRSGLHVGDPMIRWPHEAPSASECRPQSEAKSNATGNKCEEKKKEKIRELWRLLCAFLGSGRLCHHWLR